MKRILLLPLAISGAFVAAPASALDLALVCEGTVGYSTKEVDSNGTIGSVLDDEVTFKPQQLRDRIRFRFAGDTGEVRIPATVLAATGRDKSDGWYRLTDIKSDENRIEARFGFGLFSKARVRIDRRSGEAEINGGTNIGFSGACQRAPEEPSAPKF